jgi:hypothetical protein
MDLSRGLGDVYKRQALSRMLMQVTAMTTLVTVTLRALHAQQIKRPLIGATT